MKTVIEMAEDVGAGIADLPMEDAVLFEVDILSGRSAKLEAFAALVRADERADLYKEIHDPLVLACKKMVADEREACADAVRFADNGTEAAEIIRARGNT